MSSSFDTDRIHEIAEKEGGTGDTREFRIFGPPGTGKTTNLSRQVRRAVDRYGPHAVLVTSFSRAAATELAGRDLPIAANSIGTLHSHCWHALGGPEIAEANVEEWNRDNPGLIITPVKKQGKLDGEETGKDDEDSETTKLGDERLGDPATDIVYLYSEHCQGNTPPAVHAQGILSRGRWIAGVIDLVAVGKSESDRWRLLQIYRDLGLDLQVAEHCEQSGIYEVLQRMSSGRLKVFGTLAHFFQEYRLYRRDTQGQVVKQNDLLMNCLRSLCVSGRGRMGTEPPPPQAQYWSTILPGTPGGWMI